VTGPQAMEKVYRAFTDWKDERLKLTFKVGGGQFRPFPRLAR
jgi:hypothetical protein